VTAARAVSLTVGALLEAAAARLRGAGVEAARSDARLLLAAALGVEVSTVFGYPERAVGPAASARFEALLARRAAREPVSRILGRREFWGLELLVTPAILDPRPESETLVEAVLEAVGERDAALRILDLGTGSGCLLLALLSELPNAWGLGVDLSLEALEVARDNAARLGLAGRAGFVCGDWSAGLGGRWQVIVGNPPYVSEAGLATLAPEVAGHDPRLALTGGGSGLEAYRRLIPTLPERLDDAGLCALEIGFDQAEAVRALLAGAGFAQVALRADLAGRARCLVARGAPEVRSRRRNQVKKCVGMPGDTD